MEFFYDGFCKILIDDEHIRPGKAITTMSHTIDKKGFDENMRIDMPGRICRSLKCYVSEILEYRVEEENE